MHVLNIIQDVIGYLAKKTLIKGVTYRQFNTNYAKSSKPLVFYEVSYLLLFRGSFGDRKNDDGGGGIHSRRGGRCPATKADGGDDDNESVTKSNGLKPERKRRISDLFIFYS